MGLKPHGREISLWIWLFASGWNMTQPQDDEQVKQDSEQVERGASTKGVLGRWWAQS